MQLGNDQTSAIQFSKNQDIYIQSNKLATWQAIMLAFVPISLACKGNTKCQAKYSSNSRMITATLGTAGGSRLSLPPPQTEQQKDQCSPDEVAALEKQGINSAGICKLCCLCTLNRWRTQFSLVS